MASILSKVGLTGSNKVALDNSPHSQAHHLPASHRPFYPERIILDMFTKDTIEVVFLPLRFFFSFSTYVVRQASAVRECSLASMCGTRGPLATRHQPPGRYSGLGWRCT